MRPQVYSSGFLVFRQSTRLEFLLMRHARRFDLPKGHLDFGETKKQAALRELEEETGIRSSDIWIDTEFEYCDRYWVEYPKDAGRKLKELSIFLAFLRADVPISPTEHHGFDWVGWAPPHTIQRETIDPLLAQVAVHFQRKLDWPKCENSDSKSC